MEPAPPGLMAVFTGCLTREQKILVEQMERAAEALAQVIGYGTLSITYHGCMPTDYELDKRGRARRCT